MGQFNASSIADLVNHAVQARSSPIDIVVLAEGIADSFGGMAGLAKKARELYESCPAGGQQQIRMMTSFMELMAKVADRIGPEDAIAKMSNKEIAGTLFNVLSVYNGRQPSPDPAVPTPEPGPGRDHAPDALADPASPGSPDPAAAPPSPGSGLPDLGLLHADAGDLSPADGEERITPLSALVRSAAVPREHRQDSADHGEQSGREDFERMLRDCTDSAGFAPVVPEE